MILYHAGESGIVPGSLYQGADREKLSELLGGPVGFAYMCNLWGDEAGVYEIAVPDDNLVAISLLGEGLPRRDYDDGTFEEYLNRYAVRVCPAAQLANFTLQCVSEVAFLAKGARFVRELGKL